MSQLMTTRNAMDQAKLLGTLVTNSVRKPVRPIQPQHTDTYWDLFAIVAGAAVVLAAFGVVGVCAWLASLI